MLIPPYRAPVYLPGGHLQTIWPAKYMSLPPWLAFTEVWITPDNDQLAVDVWMPKTAPTRLLILLHGLEGGRDSHYARRIGKLCERVGWALILPHFRGCGGLSNMQPRAYHAGDDAELDWLLPACRARFPALVAAVVGVSLGGNMLLRWLARHPQQTVVDRAVALSVPCDLPCSGRVLSAGLNHALYGRYFLQSLRPKALALLQQHPDVDLNIQSIRDSRTLDIFDHHFTAPLHGFAGAAQYWQRAASRPLLKQIQTPTLFLVARNDPFIPADGVPHSSEFGPGMVDASQAFGGHAGFPNRGEDDWMSETVARWML